MTRITLSFKDKELNMQVTGHAERSNDEDVNLCCAGISMLVNTAIECVQRYAEVDWLSEIHVINRSGKSKLYAKAYDYTENKLTAIFDMLEAGFDLLEARYPGKITRGEIKK